MTDDSEKSIQLNKSNSAEGSDTTERPEQSQQNNSGTAELRPWGIDQKTFLVLLHLSLLTGFMIPFGGIVLPLVMWLTNKDEFSEVDKHGKVIANWMISYTIYFLVCVMLSFVLIGIPLLILLTVYAIVIVIIASVKASDGELWHYPLSIKFLK